jgi:hypothetical protein
VEWQSKPGRSRRYYTKSKSRRAREKRKGTRETVDATANREVWGECHAAETPHDEDPMGWARLRLME